MVHAEVEIGLREGVREEAETEEEVTVEEEAAAIGMRAGREDDNFKTKKGFQ